MGTTYKVVKMKDGFFGVAEFVGNEIKDVRSSNWTESMANYELGFYLDGTLSMSNNDLYAKNSGK